MSVLAVEHFAEFFREVNGNAPFPWQERLARQVCAAGGWPRCLDLPTASGKTAVIEIAVFHLALEAIKPRRQAPVRIAFVVDRRLIVDQAEARARAIQEKLERAEGPVTQMVAERLRQVAGPRGRVLEVAKLRGGVPREKDWARTPVQPTVLLSTVDQVGSRLLFRGYGVSDSMKPVHAGLLGSDCLLFLDEAHLSEPFRQTLGWVDRYRQAPWSETIPAPWEIVSLSATPATAGEPFRLSEADLENDTLGRRLAASKQAALIEVSDGGQAASFAEQAELFAKAGLRKILVVVNRVNLARQIFEELGGEERAALLIGRCREVDRDKILARYASRLASGAAAEDKPLFVVATQCVEAGADFDFDGLVTQIAPLDSLRQRFGRLNRLGRPIEARAAILATKTEIKGKKPDPVYGDRLAVTWDLLKNTLGVEVEKDSFVDFGVMALSAALEAKGVNVQQACSIKKDSPVMPPAYVDLWQRTSPPPEVEPDVPLFLHGPESGPQDVQVVWRADLELRDLERIKELIGAVPPRSAETIAVPVWSVKRWLGGLSGDMLSDAEGQAEPDEREAGHGRPVLRWFGEDDDRTKVAEPSAIRPGDLIIVPTSYGGCDQWGWSGDGKSRSLDVAELAAQPYWGREIAIRLHKGVFENLCETTEQRQAWPGVARVISDWRDDPRDLLQQLLEHEELPPLIKDGLSRLDGGKVEFGFEYDGGQVVLVGSPPHQKRSGEASTEGNDGRSLGVEAASLEKHSKQVVHFAQAFSIGAVVGDDVRGAIEFAAEFHDAGKGDLRFQAYLENGDPPGVPRAKSTRRHLGPAGERALREKVGLPERWRHEALSVRLALAALNGYSGEMDAELAVWLIGTHHGHGRPFFPHDDALDDRNRVLKVNGKQIELAAESGPQRPDFEWRGMDWPELFERLTRRYGAWELARFEAIVRLADHRASEGSGEV